MKTILFRADSLSQIGMWHIMRDLGKGINHRIIEVKYAK